MARQYVYTDQVCQEERKVTGKLIIIIMFNNKFANYFPLEQLGQNSVLCNFYVFPLTRPYNLNYFKIRFSACVCLFYRYLLIS